MLLPFLFEKQNEVILLQFLKPQREARSADDPRQPRPDDEERKTSKTRADPSRPVRRRRPDPGVQRSDDQNHRRGRIEELQSINSETLFDRIVAEAQQLQEPLIIVWTASWCRKCIYLKPKLEKLAANYYPRLRFYYVDVNTVPHKLVAHAGVTKMPTIQLWKDSKKQDEVIGGHRAFLVINEVRQMIENATTASND